MKEPLVNIASAVQLLLEGGVVAVPTETVYGLAADASNTDAVIKIFETKGRPADNPLIVHVESIDQACSIGQSTKSALLLMEAFWPGPLTIIMDYLAGVCDSARANLNTVAVRMPDHETFLSIIHDVGTAIVAPSANKSGWPSPTTAQHVIDDFNGAVSVVDGGPCRLGLESTVVKIQGNTAAILRPGAITARSIENLGFTVSSSIAESIHSPGTRHRHYSPNAEVRLFFDSIGLTEAAARSDSAVVLARIDPKTSVPWRKLEGANLYAELRRADAMGLKEILVHCDDTVCLDAALIDRLQRASEQGSKSGGT